MYFWNTKALSKDIKDKTVSDNEWKNYYLAFSLMITFSMYITTLAPRENITALLAEGILMLGIIIFGINITFKTHQNNGSSFSNYIAKMTALSFPLTIKFILASMVVGFVIGIAEASGLPAVFGEWALVLLTVTVQTLMFWRLNVHLHSINT